MLFTEPRFALFFVVCFVLRWLLPKHNAQKTYLLLCSYFFYGAWDWRFLFLIFTSTTVDFLAALRISAEQEVRRRRLWLAMSLVANLGFLGFFKYYNFFAQSGSSVLDWLGLNLEVVTLDIVLPVGISFYTFQSMSYTIDVYRRKLTPIRNFRDYALFVGFFPQLVAGPIVRASDFLPQLASERSLKQVDFRGCLALFWIGYLKKACIADNIAAVIDPVFADPSLYGAQDILLAAVGYSVQIYCDFSGYSDMAIAAAGLLGYQLCLNFDAPYLAVSVRDFWRRWHISLSTWLRDYLYISLGGNRDTRARIYRNLMITMVLGGLWHGANMTFVLWGTVHGLALCLQRFWRENKVTNGAQNIPGFGLISWMMTLSWVILCFTLFRCDSIQTFRTLWLQLYAGGSNELSPLIWYVILGIGIVHLAAYRFRPQLTRLMNRAPTPLFAFAFGVAVSVALFFTPIRNAPFIYFQF
jgi:alginate O-acetyltransferase complex protein AlgI